MLQIQANILYLLAHSVNVLNKDGTPNRRIEEDLKYEAGKGWRVSAKFNPNKAQYDNLIYQSKKLGSKKTGEWEKIGGMFQSQNYPNYVNSFKNDLNYRLYGKDKDNLK